MARNLARAARGGNDDGTCGAHTGVISAMRSFTPTSMTELQMSAPNPAIFPVFEAFYIQSMLFNANSAMESYSRVSDVLDAIEDKNWDEIREMLDSQSLLDELQNIVLQGAALSRYFWPVRPEYVARGEQLRNGIGLAENSALKSRSLRNALEHFDERLDVYLNQGIVGRILPQYVGPAPQKEQVPYHLFRGFFLDTGEFTLLGEKYDMQPLVEEIVYIYDALMYSEDQGGRLQPPPAAGASS